jgi:hypothetical protein
MTDHGDEQALGIPWVDDVGNLSTTAKAGVRPPGVGRLVDAVANRQVRTRQPFSPLAT